MSLFVLSLIAATVQPVQEATRDEKPDIVVTARPVASTAKALENCLRNGCPPRVDIAAALAHAENLFVAGRYGDGRRTTAAAIRRNKQFAAQFPIEVSNLMRANSRLAAHEGEGDVYRSSLLDMQDTLRKGLGANDPRTLAARIEVADSYISFGKLRDAERQYNAVAATARKAGERGVEGYAMLRKAIILSMSAIEDPVMDGRARRALNDLTTSTVAEHKPFADAAQLLRARIQARNGDTQALDEMLRRRERAAGTKPVLIYAEPVDFKRGPDFRKLNGGSSVTSQMLVGDVQDQWVDIAFQIASDGSVSDIETIRTSEGFEGNWVDPILTSIRSRRYVPVALAAGEPGMFRIERYTKTARMTSTTGSRIRQREPVWRVEMLDLTAEPVQTTSAT